MKSMLSVLSLTLFLAGGAAAQTGPAGKWEESTSSGLNAALNLTATDTTLAGTFTIRARPMTITDGKVTKNTLTFKAALEGQPEGFSGELKGDELELWRDRNGRTDVITLKRVKAGLVGKWQGQTPNGMSLTLDLTGGRTIVSRHPDPRRRDHSDHRRHDLEEHLRLQGDDRRRDGNHRRHLGERSAQSVADQTGAGTPGGADPGREVGLGARKPGPAARHHEDRRDRAIRPAP